MKCNSCKSTDGSLVLVLTASDAGQVEAIRYECLGCLNLF